MRRCWFLFLPLLAACDVPTAPPLPAGAERFAPPPAYELWWSMTRECSGRDGALSAVRWYVVPDATSILIDGKRYEGYWYASGNRVVLAADAMLDGPLVRHEMLHALLGAGHHRRSEFLTQCGGIVACDGECLDDAEPLPPSDPDVTRVPPDALEIAAVVRPQTPSSVQYGGHFTLTVTVRNPRSEPVVVTLPPSSDAGPPVSFRYRVEPPGGFFEGNVRALDEGVTRFAPGETKRHAFDFHVAGTSGPTGVGGLPPATYDLLGAYGGQWTPATTVTLSPP